MATASAEKMRGGQPAIPATLRTLLGGTWCEAAVVTAAPHAQAAAIARLAWRRYQAGLAGDAATIEPNYVRRSDAELLRSGPAA